MNTVNMHQKASGETRTIIVGFGEKLTGDPRGLGCYGRYVSYGYPRYWPYGYWPPELLTGTPTVDELETNDLTLSNPTLVIADCEVAGRIIKAFQGVQFSVSGGTPGDDYRIRVTAVTDTSPVQTVSANIGLSVYA